MGWYRIKIGSYTVTVKGSSVPLKENTEMTECIVCVCVCVCVCVSVCVCVCGLCVGSTGIAAAKTSELAKRGAP